MNTQTTSLEISLQLMAYMHKAVKTYSNNNISVAMNQNYVL